MTSRAYLCFSCSIYTLPLLFLILKFSAASGNSQLDSCGQVQNITCPFVLRGSSPASCRSNFSKTYDLVCANITNTLLSLYSGTFLVQAINYNNFTIRVSDPGVQKTDCSSVPRYPLSLFNFSNGWNFTMMDLYAGEATFISCPNPITNDPRFVSRSSCANRTSSSLRPYQYVLGESSAKVLDMPNLCRVDLVTVVQRGKFSKEPMSISYEKLSYGFEMSFYESNCRKCRAKGYKFSGKGEKTRCRLICGSPPDRILPEWEHRLRFIVRFYVPLAVIVFLIGKFLLCACALAVVIVIIYKHSRKKQTQ